MFRGKKENCAKTKSEFEEKGGTCEIEIGILREKKNVQIEGGKLLNRVRIL